MRKPLDTMRTRNQIDTMRTRNQIDRTRALHGGIAWQGSGLLDDLDDVLVVEQVFLAHPLWAELDGRAPNQCAAKKKTQW